MLKVVQKFPFHYECSRKLYHFFVDGEIRERTEILYSTTFNCSIFPFVACVLVKVMGISKLSILRKIPAV